MFWKRTKAVARVLVVKLSRLVFIQCHTILEVYFDPFVTSTLPIGFGVGVGAVERASEGVVEARLFNNNFNGGIVRPGDNQLRVRRNM